MGKKKRSKRIRLDDRVVANLPFARRQYAVWDLTTEGCGVRVSRSVKSCIIKMRMGKEKPKTETIGMITPATPYECLREQALKRLAVLKKTRRPRFVPEGELTLQEARKEYFVTHPELSSTTIQQYTDWIDRDFPLWVQQPLMLLTSDVILEENTKRVRLLEAADPDHRPPKGIYGWHGTLRALRALVTWYAAVKNRPSPWPSRKALPLKAPRARTLPIELQCAAGRRKLVEGLRAMGTPAACACLFLCFTGFRRRESARLTRGHLLNPVVVEFKSKTRVIRVPLAKQAVELLDRNSNTTLLKVSMYAMGNPLKQIFGVRTTPRGKRSCVTPHDMRRLFKTVGTELGIDPTIINILVGHSIKGVDASYIAKLRPAVLRAAAQRIVEEILNPQELPGEDELLIFEDIGARPTPSIVDPSELPTLQANNVNDYLTFPQPSLREIRLPHSHYLSRADLYQLVWTVPMVELAERFGLSDRGLAKACGRADIPVPPRGYWAKVTGGRLIERPSLPAPPKGLIEPIRIRGANPAPESKPSLPISAADPRWIPQTSDEGDQSSQAVSACADHRDWIREQVERGRTAMSIYNDLVRDHGFTHAYNSVKRFVSQIKKNLQPPDPVSTPLLPQPVLIPEDVSSQAA